MKKVIIFVLLSTILVGCGGAKPAHDDLWQELSRRYPKCEEFIRETEHEPKDLPRWVATVDGRDIPVLECGWVEAVGSEVYIFEVIAFPCREGIAYSLQSYTTMEFGALMAHPTGVIVSDHPEEVFIRDALLAECGLTLRGLDLVGVLEE